MALSLLSRNKKAILARCRDDSLTAMRHKYAPWYHAIESQLGTAIRLDGKDMIMLSSNDYLGLSFHPKVMEASRAAMRQSTAAPTALCWCKASSRRSQRG